MAKNINYLKKMSFKTKKYKHFQAIFEFVTVFTGGYIYIYKMYIDRLTPMPRILIISITLMSIWLTFGETVTQK